jgi:four helix bundle protein
MLIVHKVALEAVAALRPLVGPIRRQDKSLADQVRRAASSMLLNIAEAEYSDPGNSRARLYNAAGSANETVAALEVALAWRYIEPDAADQALALLDRVKAILWRLNHCR